MHDPHILYCFHSSTYLSNAHCSITVLWHDDDGAKYAEFVTEQMREGGFYRGGSKHVESIVSDNVDAAIEDGLIAAPFDSYAMAREHTTGVDTPLHRGDVLHFVATADEKQNEVERWHKQQDDRG